MNSHVTFFSVCHKLPIILLFVLSRTGLNNKNVQKKYSTQCVRNVRPKMGKRENAKLDYVVVAAGTNAFAFYSFSW